MPLPTDPNQQWPPLQWAGVQRDMVEADAWYSGEESKLANFYGGVSQNIDGNNRPRFWSRRKTDIITGRQRVHVPAAADIAATSADLLFGEMPALTIAEAHGEQPDSDAEATEARLQELVELDGIASTLLEGAEVNAAIGGVYLRPMWDASICDHPILTIVHGDHAVPEFRWGYLIAVTFWREVTVDGPKGAVWRHLERHESGVILHGLFCGDVKSLGVRRPLEECAELQSIALAANEEGAIQLPEGITGLVVRYVPNALPNRKWRGLTVGRSDFAGTESLMDSLDETMTSWMRDIRLAKARLVVPSEFLDRNGRGKGAQFDLEAEVFSPLEMDPASSKNAGITAVQFAIRTVEHAETCEALFERIVVTSGYSPQSFGLQADHVKQTATEVNALEDRSSRTTAKKKRHWAQAVEDVAEILLIIDVAVFGSKVKPMRPRCDFGDGVSSDPVKVATTVELLNRAQALSVEAKVRMAQPELDETEVQAEVDRIKAEQGISVGDPTGGFP